METIPRDPSFAPPGASRGTSRRRSLAAAKNTAPASRTLLEPAPGSVSETRYVLKNQERESSESPMLKAFWRVAPSVLFSFLAICEAFVFLRAIAFSSRSSLEVHARRFFFLFAITPP
ncbi:MAG TPA: hypothetical protein VEK34_10150 [Methylocella sp.]|nr:hypothetical protein [Methylocella sp.]